MTTSEPFEAVSRKMNYLMDELEKILEVKSLKDVELQKKNQKNSLLGIPNCNYSNYNNGFKWDITSIEKTVKLDSAKY